MEIYYANSRGQEIRFDRFPYMIQNPETLLSYEWSYQTTGERISSFKKSISTKDFTISIWADSREEFGELADAVVDILEYDIRNLSPGRLYYGSAYIPCYIYMSDYNDFEEDFYTTDKKLKIVADDPDWIRETTASFFMGTDEETGASNLDYPYDFSFDYASGQKGQLLINNAVSGSDFQIIIYGPCANPEILIGGYRYAVSANLDDGEYLVINSVSKKIYKVKINGETVNQYHLKDTEYYIFRKIPAGRNSVSWSGLFGFDVTLYEKRSEPRWI